MNSLWGRAAFAGIAAGIAMLALLIIAAATTGFDWDSPLRWIAAVLMSEPALILAGQAQGGMSATACLVLGLIIHLIAATAFAAAFVTFASAVSGWRGLAVGIGYGLAIWAVMRFGLLPMFDTVMAARVQLVPMPFLLAHVVYGSILAAITMQKVRSPEP
jgi:hypothetical protein